MLRTAEDKAARSHDTLWMQGLLNKQPAQRLGWPRLLEHPFVAETEAERAAREAALAEAARLAGESRGWRGEVRGTRLPFICMQLPTTVCMWHVQCRRILLATSRLVSLLSDGMLCCLAGRFKRLDGRRRLTCERLAGGHAAVGAACKEAFGFCCASVRAAADRGAAAGRGFPRTTAARPAGSR